MSTLKVNALQDTSGKGFYPARVWLRMNGTGTITINNDGNVSSLTDGGTGVYTANFTNTTPHSTYALVGTGSHSSGTAIIDFGDSENRWNHTTSSANFVTGYGAGESDVARICVNITG